MKVNHENIVWFKNPEENLTYEEAKERVPSDYIKKYIADEFNVRV